MPIKRFSSVKMARQKVDSLSRIRDLAKLVYLG